MNFDFTTICSDYTPEAKLIKWKTLKLRAFILSFSVANPCEAESPLYDMQELLDTSTLDVEVLDEWYIVKGDVPTRQKLVTIRVGELWQGQGYRIW